MIEETTSSMEKKLNLKIEPLLCIIDDIGYDHPLVFLTRIYQESGIYYFMDEKLDMLYIGKSQKLRVRVSNHHHNRNKTEPWMNNVKYIAIRPCAADSIREVEKQEILKYDPLFNKKFRARGSKVGSRLTEIEKLDIEFDYISQKIDKLNILLADALHEQHIINDKKHLLLEGNSK